MNEQQRTPVTASSATTSGVKSAAHFLSTRILIGAAVFFMVAGIGLIVYGVVGGNAEASRAYAVFIGTLGVFIGIVVMLLAGLVEWLLKPKQKSQVK